MARSLIDVFLRTSIDYWISQSCSIFVNIGSEYISFEQQLAILLL